MNADTKMKKARIGLLLDEPFFGSLLLNLDSRRDDSIQTMCTNGVMLRWSGAFVDKLSLEQVRTVLAHEVMHCALLHTLRRGSRDSRKWNQAADYAVNAVLEESNTAAAAQSKVMPFPWPAEPFKPLLNPAYNGKSAEEIFGMIPEPPPSSGGGGGKGGKGGGKGQPQDGDGDGMGEVEDAPGAADEAKQAEQEATWKVNVQQAASMAKGRGNLPASMARLVEEMLNPPKSWQEILRRFVRDNAKDDFSWTRPNPRYAHTGFILPSLHSQKLGRIVIGIDTSGSISPAILNAFFNELQGILSEARPSGVVLIDCDAEVQKVYELDATDPLPREYHGGGGTDFRPVFKWVQKNLSEPPVCLIYLTDMDGSFPDKDPGYPVLWGSYGSDQQGPFGETIRIDGRAE